MFFKSYYIKIHVSKLVLTAHVQETCCNIIYRSVAYKQALVFELEVHAAKLQESYA